jgi:hypothetical protein
LGGKGGEEGVGVGEVGEEEVGEGEGIVGDIDGIGKLDGARISWFSKGKGATFGAVCGDGGERDGEGGAQERGESCSSSSSSSSSPRNSSTSHLCFAAFLSVLRAEKFYGTVRPGTIQSAMQLSALVQDLAAAAVAPDYWRMIRCPLLWWLVAAYCRPRTRG